MGGSLKRCRNFSRKGAKPQRRRPLRTQNALRLSSLRLCAFAGKILLVLFSLWIWSASAQTKPISERAAATAMTALWRDNAGYPAKWTYDHGLVLKGIERVWHNTGDKQYLDFIQSGIDHFVAGDGSIRTYAIDDYNIDNILPGRNLLFLYRITGQEKYRKAATLLREQLKTHPRTPEGGFWHKKIYPSQMWLDGLYMGEPFYAEYAVTFNEVAAFDDIAKQFILMERHARDDKTGLLYHGWDESRKQRWSNPATGRSPNFWGRAMGWFAMALVDTLDHFPRNHPQRAELIAMLNRLAQAVATYQEPRSGLWYQVLDKGGEKGNYLESSAACMFVYALAKGVRNGYLPAGYREVAEKGYRGILREFVKMDASGQLNLEGTVSVAGLGGNPYRDGSYEYYVSEKVVTNDPKGIGALLLAATEMETMGKRRKKT
jgi:unsaturated rhamnogalacturonyl hydrolase